jgi:hypothetical protein
MLQRIHDSLAKWVIVIVLGLIAFSFIFWGVDFGMTGVTTFAAKVNGEDVPVTDFDQALQQRQKFGVSCGARRSRISSPTSR